MSGSDQEYLMEVNGRSARSLEILARALLGLINRKREK